MPVKMVFDHAVEYESQWAAIASVATKIGCSEQTLCNGVRQYEGDNGGEGANQSFGSIDDRP